jgi:hypothetical protein
MKALLYKVSSIVLIGSALALASCRVSVGYYQNVGFYRHHHHHSYCQHHRCSENMAAYSFDGGNESQVDIEQSAQTLAHDFAIRPESARKIIEAINTDSSQLKDQFERIGVPEKDVKALADLQMPSQNSIQKVAHALNEDPAKIEGMTIRYIEDMKQQGL